eukprot:Phypoly_transcript_06012.p1 GENE.Phypoly_transcript_06012~~Phypoly_transcript_06012.p1  ORF type:complete len:484 (+),score=68.04 Phypoly_transcript_06012:207-1454(+)
MGQVVGANNKNLSDIEKATGAICDRIRDGIVVLGSSMTQVQLAVDYLHRVAEMGHSLTRQLVFTDYSPEELIRFIRPPPSLVIGYGAGVNDPHILSKEQVVAESEHKFTQKFQDFLQSAMKQFENKAGRISFQARYGKSVFFKLSDEAKTQVVCAESLVAHEAEQQKSYRTSFTTGVNVQSDLHHLLEMHGQPSIKETYNFKTIAKHEGKYHTIQVNLFIVGDGEVICDSVYGKEAKFCIDQASMDQNKLDVRLALQFAEMIQEDHFLFPYAQDLVNSINVTYEDGISVLSYTPPKNMFVYTIRHKQIKTYNYENIFKIDVAEIRMVDYHDKLYKIETDLGAQQPEFDKLKTEVEFSYTPWRKAFKYNRCLAGGNIGDHIRQKSNPSEWKAEELCKDLGKIIDEAVSLSKVIFAL